MRLFKFIPGILLIVLVLLSGCDPQHRALRERQKQEKQMEQRQEESEKIREKARKRHYEMQTRETQKRMNETKSKSEEWHLRNVPFYKRWYRAIVSFFKGL